MDLLFVNQTGGEDGQSRTTEMVFLLRIRGHWRQLPTNTRPSASASSREDVCVYVYGVISGQRARKRKHGTRAF